MKIKEVKNEVILIKNQRERNNEVEDNETLCTQSVWKNLDGIAGKEKEVQL